MYNGRKVSLVSLYNEILHSKIFILINYNNFIKAKNSIINLINNGYKEIINKFPMQIKILRVENSLLL